MLIIIYYTFLKHSCLFFNPLANSHLFPKFSIDKTTLENWEHLLKLDTGTAYNQPCARLAPTY